MKTIKKYCEKCEERKEFEYIGKHFISSGDGDIRYNYICRNCNNIISLDRRPLNVLERILKDN